MEEGNNSKSDDTGNLQEAKSAQGGSSSVGTIGKRKRRSIAWDHFQVIPGTINGEAVDFAKCNYCPTKYQYSGKGINGSTGNMMSHLKKKHSQFLNAEGPVQSQQEYVFSQEYYGSTVLKWIVEREQPIAELQQSTFLEVVRSLNPFAEMISSASLQQDLIKLYADSSKSVKHKLSQVPSKVSFTVMKKEINGQTFLKIVAHWIDNWKIESDILDFCYMKDKDSMSIACDLFVGCLKRYEIPFSKVLCITLENVSENYEFIVALCNEGNANGDTISSAENILECLQNVTNSSVQELLSYLLGRAKDERDDVIVPVTKLRSLILTIQSSRELQQELKEMSSLMGVEGVTLCIDEKPHSTLKMIESAARLQQPLRAVRIKMKSLSESMISEDDWKVLHTLKKLLQKFHRATGFVPISSYLATVNWLIDSLNSIIDEERDVPLVHATKTCLTKIESYKMKMSQSKIPFITTLLNPALKTTYFKEHNYNKSDLKNIEKEVHEIYKMNYEVKGSMNADKSDDDDDELFSHMYKRAKTDQLSKEFQKFLRYPLSSPKSDVLDFWKLNESEFPCLAKMAKDYMGASSSVHGSEQVMLKDDESLNVEYVHATHCLRYWLKTKN